MIEWLNLRETSAACGFADTRTFLKHYIDKYPPDRQQGDRKWWTRETVELIKSTEFLNTTKEGA